MRTTAPFRWKNTRKVVEALRAVGSPCIKYEEYSAGSTTPDPHQVWQKVYSDRNGTPYNWLFQQSRSRSADHTQTRPGIHPGDHQAGPDRCARL